MQEKSSDFIIFLGHFFCTTWLVFLYHLAIFLPHVAKKPGFGRHRRPEPF
jgi:hypothetical protein